MGGSRPRVAVVTPELHRTGGTERSLTEQVIRWRRRFDLRVVTERVEGIGLTAEELLRVPRLPSPHLVQYVWWLLANRLVRLAHPPGAGVDVTMSPGVNALDADAIGVHIIFAKYWDRVGKAEARRSSTAFLRAAHRMLFVALFRAVERRAYEGPALLWAMSGRDARDLEERFGRPAGSVVTVPHGVDAEAFHPSGRVSRRPTARVRLGLDEDDSLLLLMGNDLIKKGADHAMAALALLPSSVRLGVAGRYVPDELHVLADSAGVSERVLTLSHVDDPVEYYAAADVLVAPSREDSFHLPALEAMACGIPVVLSKEAGVSELVVDGKDAIVIDDPADAPALAGAITRVLDEPELAESLAAEGRRLAQRLTWDENARRTAALLDREARTPRVLVLAPDPGGTGGIQRATRVLLTALCDLYGPDRVGTVSVRRQLDASIPGRVLRSGQPVVGRRQRVSFITQARYSVASIVTSRRWRRRLALFVAHPHLAPVAWACRLVSGAPYAVWCHGVESWGQMPPLVARGLRAADAVFAPSEFTARRVEEVARLRPRSVRVVPHGVVQRAGEIEPPTQKEHPPVVLCVARLMRENRYKGIDTLLYAWPRVLEEVDATLLIVGHGPDMSRLQRIAGALDLDSSVRFAGRVTDEELAAAYASSSVFAMPARHRLEPRPQGEGFGLVFIEAGAAGLPVVAGRGGGVEDVVEDGGSGILVDARDHRSVAHAVIGLLLDPQRARAMGERGRELATTRFAYDAFRTQVAALVRDLRPKGLL